jgi:glycosyltransferase involved in cell wall biosynthesis
MRRAQPDNFHRLRVLFATPAYWPLDGFGGPASQTRELARGLARRGHAVEVVTTSLAGLDRRPRPTTTTASVDGVTVHYLGTPIRYRWMGVTPTIRRRLDELERPDVVHVFGYRDFVGTLSARWAFRQGIPYVFEGLGMVRPMLRKVALKRAADRTVYRPVIRDAALLVAASSRERDNYLEAGVGRARIEIRPIGFPAPQSPASRPGPLRRRAGVDPTTPLVLSLGRVARGKGIDLLVRSLPGLETAHLAVVGPDDRGTADELARIARELHVDDRVHLVGRWPDPGSLLELYADADVFALASEYESFGMAAAEAAAAGTASVVTDRCGIAELLADGAALVVPHDQTAVREALEQLLADGDLRRRMGERARAVAAEWSWPTVVELQEALYRRVLGPG